MDPMLYWENFIFLMLNKEPYHLPMLNKKFCPNCLVSTTALDPTVAAKTQPQLGVTMTMEEKGWGRWRGLDLPDLAITGSPEQAAGSLDVAAREQEAWCFFSLDRLSGEEDRHNRNGSVCWMGCV